MEGIRFKLRRVEAEANAELDQSKLLGAPTMPEGFFASLPLENEDYFVGQIRCDGLPIEDPFPKKGYLYFFLNVDSLKPKVFYTDKEPGELIDDVNANFDPESCGDPTCLQLDFADAEEGESFLFGPVDERIGLEGETDLAGKLTLLQIDAYALPQDEQKPFRFGPFGLNDGYWVFLIKEADLKKGNFDKVEFYELEV